MHTKSDRVAKLRVCHCCFLSTDSFHPMLFIDVLSHLAMTYLTLKS
jgi:hypothetical protein